MNFPTSSRLVRKNWNFSFHQTEALYTLLEELLAPLGCAALVLPDGKALHVRPSSPADLATLPQAAALCHQYLRLRDGDIAIVNDPSSGGMSLSAITLVAGVRFETEAELLLVRRLDLAPLLTAHNRLDAEGVRIPPTPLASTSGLASDDAQINIELLGAIAAHPLAPRGLQASVLQALEEITVTIREIKSMARDPGSELKRAGFKRYFADCSRVFKAVMSRLPLGTTLVSSQLDTGETLKLRLEIGENRLHFDFAGTDGSTTIALTEVATFGACVAATAAALHDPIPLNAGSFEHLQVSTPAKTLLSGGQTSVGMFRGMNSGIAAVCALVETAFVNLNPALRAAGTAGCEGHFQIRFDDGRILTGRLAPGTGARKNAAGLAGYATWAPRVTHDLASIEKLERAFPVSVTFAGVRAGSGGQGKHPGGDGEIRALTVNMPGVFRWSLQGMTERPAGLESGRAGLAAQVEIVRAHRDGHEVFNQPEGEVALAVGDQIRVLSTGGGGYGEAE